MSDSQKNQIIFDAIYNEGLRRFEVHMIDEANNIKSLVLTQTHEEIIQALKHMMINTLQALSDVAKQPGKEKTVSIDIGTVNLEKKD